MKVNLDQRFQCYESMDRLSSDLVMSSNDSCLGYTGVHDESGFNFSCR